MKAAVLERLGKITVKSISKPRIGKGEMLVKVVCCAVCGSDLRIYHRGNPRVKPPQILGHEIAGEVVEVGKGVETFKVGDKVALGADVPCGVCDFCRSGLGNNCSINYAIGYQFQGGFAEYIPLNETTVKYGPVHKIPFHLDFEEASLAEPLACCLNGYELAGLRPGETVLIIGAGPVGCMLVELARHMGATKIILAQRSKQRLKMAKKFSANVYISTTEEDLVQKVKEETEGEGVDVVMVACASSSAQEEALKVVAHRGRVNFFGGLPPGEDAITIQSNIVHYREAFILGSHGSVPRQHRIALDLLDRYISARDFITHRFPLEEINRAFQTVENREGMKVLVTC